MAMQVTKAEDFREQMRREHQERAERKRVAALIANDTPELLTLDLWDTVKALYANVLLVTEGGSETRRELYRQLEEFHARLTAQGFEAEWESVKEAMEHGR